MTEPVVRPIRAVLPSFGGIDLSPLVVLLLIRYVVQPLLLHEVECQRQAVAVYRERA